MNQSSAARLRSLKTQLNYRLDQGQGTCLYRVGVEDNGCHSLLDYEDVAKSCCVLEYLARSLNAVVTERLIILSEVAKTKDGTFVKLPDADTDRIREPTILGDSIGRRDEISPEDAQRVQQSDAVRAELTIQKVETHALDPPSIPLSEASIMGEKDISMVAPSTINGHAKPENVVKKETKKTDVGETMSSRNIRVAVVGNVDAGKSTLIGVSEHFLMYKPCLNAQKISHEYDTLACRH